MSDAGTRDPRILVLRGGALGDFVLTLPAIAKLRQRWPRAHVVVAGYPHIARLAAVAGLADEVVSLERRDFARLFAAAATPDPAFADWLRGFDLAISYLFDPDDIACAHLRAAGVSQVLYGDPRVRERHAASHGLRALEPLALYEEGEESVALAWPAAAVAAARERLEAAVGMRGPVVVLHPGSGSPHKNWPLDRYLALAPRLRAATGAAVLFTAGEADTEALARLPAADVPFVLPSDLPDLAGLLAAAAGYLGNDSGVTHLAAALGVPVVALFGPTDPALWAPRGGHVRVLRAQTGRMEDLSIETVMVAAKASVVVFSKVNCCSEQNRKARVAGKTGMRGAVGFRRVTGGIRAGWGLSADNAGIWQTVRKAPGTQGAPQGLPGGAAVDAPEGARPV